MESAFLAPFVGLLSAQQGPSDKPHDLDRRALQSLVDYALAQTGLAALRGRKRRATVIEQGFPSGDQTQLGEPCSYR